MTEPLIIDRPDHVISRQDFDSDVLTVLYRLKKNGHEAYIVGGAVRDLLRGEHPKDFDVATDATPNELRKLFRNSRIIGRRFRLVHVFFGDKIFEVATLRQAVEQDEDEDDLYVMDDNCWGDVESDAFRRDFTINGLYYDIRDFSLVDYVGGVQDIDDHLVRCIGDPLLRFQEDPVRMLRAIKFAARFGYDIESETADAIEELPGEILKASRFRVTEEIFRILTQANRDVGLQMLHDFGFLEVLYPSWLEDIGEEGFEQVQHFFAEVEAHAKHGRYLPLEVICAGLFLPFLDHIDINRDQYQRRSAALSEEVRRMAVEMDLPKKLVTSVIGLLRGQLYMLFFAHRRKNVERYVAMPEFDFIWRLHDLAFGHVAALHGIQEVWLHGRERMSAGGLNGQDATMGGWVDRPDRRDIFSFRGRTGGGRHDPGQRGGPIPPTRRRRRRRGR